MDVHYGVSRFDNEQLNDNYGDYNVGVTSSLDWFDLDVRFWDTFDRDIQGDDQTVVLSISRKQ